MISYELAMGLFASSFFMGFCAGSPNFRLKHFPGLPIFRRVVPGSFLFSPFRTHFLIALFAETNRLPLICLNLRLILWAVFTQNTGVLNSVSFLLLSMPISSLVRRYSPFSSGRVALSSLYVRPLASQLDRTLLGVGWFLAKTIFLIFFFIWIRWTLPRFRYDQVMHLGWTKLLPLALANLIIYVLIVTLIDQPSSFFDLLWPRQLYWSANHYLFLKGLTSLRLLLV